jgi:hypothetical protein
MELKAFIFAPVRILKRDRQDDGMAKHEGIVRRLACRTLIPHLPGYETVRRI